MKAIAIFSLIAVAAGANIRNHFGDGCSGGYLDYPNIPHRVCCGAISGTTGSVTIFFNQLPQRSSLRGYQNTREGGICGYLAKEENVGNTDTRCLGRLSGGGTYAGSSWLAPGFRTMGEKDAACTSEMPPHALVLNDGHKFLLGGMEQKMVVELYNMAVGGATVDQLPAKYAAFEIEKEAAQQRAAEIN